MRINTFASAFVAFVAASHFVNADGVELLNNQVLDPLSVEAIPAIPSIPDVPGIPAVPAVPSTPQSILGMQKRRLPRRATDNPDHKHPHPHPKPHPKPHPQPQPMPPSGGGNGGDGGDGGDGSSGSGGDQQPSCMYNQDSGMLTGVMQDGCPAQIQPGNSGCTAGGSDAPISANVLQCSAVAILSDSDSTPPQNCNVEASNGGLISIQALQCSEVDILSIVNMKQD